MIIPPDLIEKLVDFRKELHRYPELSGKEYQTAQKVLTHLNPLQPNLIWTKVCETGIVASFDSKQEGPHLLFRAELDALPIQEINTFGHQSTVPGVSHKCGHDGHTTVLLGLAHLLAQHPLQKGKVSLLFQPAEETGAGAAAMLKDTRMDQLQPDLVFAFHNLPGNTLGEIVIKEGAISAAVRSMIIKFQGKTAHAAEPENGHNPALAIAQTILDLQKISNNEVERKDFRLITPVHVLVGEKAYGVSAGYGELHLTIRAWTEPVMEEMIAQIERHLENNTADAGLTYTIDWTDVFLGNTNAKAGYEAVKNAAKQLDFPLEERNYPLKWGEDFGYFTQKFPGAFFGIGAGEDCPALHNPDYDFPDDLIIIGMKMFSEIISQAQLWNP